ncbi:MULTISPECIES: SpoIIE family protein phosphatase [Nonomuraea]|uniref:SpoIIE family protein phosphatase n=2 Tax=Nonomuraea TaxID=83681 RepID=A0ABW1BMK7_9ACTN|nr:MULTISPECIES: SpoIIE family protein phosphatase [Nonomuraea]MDA0646074.1 SpoIIE family protein phosphatase [Nonomuraea ferruginea]TXK39348.1 SpoIIE family protein phosphatase [Nonomuraea sp. C10]
MSAETSVPRPRESDVDISDSALLKGLLSEAEFAFAFFDVEGRIQRVNDVFSDLVGVPADRLAGRAPVEALAADLSQAVTQGVQAVIESEGPVAERRLRVRSTEGSDRHWSMSFSPIHDEGGELRAVTLVGLDVTESRQIEEDLRRSEERYRSLVEAQSQLVWITTPTGTVAEDAPQWRAITGQGLEEYLAYGWLDVVHPDERPATEEAWKEALRGRTMFEWNYRVRTRASGYRHFEVRAVPIIRHGRVVEWVGANTDVTPQREAEEMRGRLTDQLGAAALRTARLQGATAQLAEALTVEQVVQVIIDVGRTALAADRSAVALLDTDRAALKLINGEGIPEASGSSGEEIPLSHSSVMTMAVNSRRPVFAESPVSLKMQLLEAGGDEQVLAHYLASSDEQAWVGLPLLAAGRALGALRFSFTRPQKISQEDGVFLEALAGQCALAVERATLFEREHRTAETLQRSLLPDHLPVVKGLELAQRFRSGSRHVQVGGDWYDAFVLQDGRVAAVVGDVMGKGVKAAAGMGRIRNAMRALALTNPPPAAVLAGLDRVFDATEEEDQVTTLAYMVVEPATGEGTLALAGHPPPVLVSPQGTAILCDAEPGTPLGWPTSRRQFRFVVPPGHTAVLYSDGLVENRKRGLDAGLTEICSVVTEAPPEVVANPHMLLDFLVDGMLSGYEQDDDVTALAIHVPAITKSD